MHGSRGKSSLALVAFLALGASCLQPGDAQAGPSEPAQARVELRIVVPRVLSMKLQGHPGTVQVTDEDIARGEVVVTGARVELVANARNGFRVRAELHNEAFAGVAVKGLASPIEVTQRVAVTWMHATAGGARPGPALVEYRFRLAAGARAGQYAWPLGLTLEDV
jgi:hypothetical protein